MATMIKKVSIIGAGNVGASTAQLIAYEGIADVVLFDIVEGIPQGKALDIAEACPLWNSSVSVKGTNSYSDTADSDVLVITAGFPRKPGMSRDDLLHANADVVRGVVSETSKLSPDAVIIVVTNPMDVMAHLAWKVSGFGHNRVMGMGGVLDSTRFRTFVSLELGVSPSDVEALVMGGHGDQMVPMPRFTTVKGIPITNILPPEKIDYLINRTRHGGAEIVSLLKTGSAYSAPAAATFQMIKAIIFDEKRILPCAAYLNGHYGVSDVYVGVPVLLGENGVEKVIEVELGDEEKRDFERSVAAVRALLEKINI
ncbi:MAG: malate dehydrogenase [Thermodesulfovibrionales bacterium]